MLDLGARSRGAIRLAARAKIRGGDREAAALLGAWQSEEIARACRYPQCRGLSVAEIEDVYQDTVIALLDHDYADEEHLRKTLRAGLRHRALNAHRDSRRHRNAIALNRTRLQPSEPGEHEAPEAAALVREDRLLVAEFLAELTPLERRVFALMVEGLKYRAIASVLPDDEKAIRTAVRHCEQKRERFQTLYNAGRLCGFRGATIEALLSGATASPELAQRALAHLEHCGQCRATHRTTAKRLRRRFEGHAAVLLPATLLHLRALRALSIRAQAATHRLTAGRLTPAGSLRERGAALLLGSGAAGKLAAGAASIAVLAGGAVGVSQALQHSHPPAIRPHHGTYHANAVPAATQLDAGIIQARQKPSEPRRVVARRTAGASKASRLRRSPGHAVPVGKARARTAAPRETGFAYLGVPKAAEPRAPFTRGATAVSQPQNGGPFSP
ncbi:MAG: RNA polymerase sigma factor [Solirubrobacteraceae bacterium]